MKRPPYQSRNSSDAGKCFEDGPHGKILAAALDVAQPSINLSAVELIPSTRMGIEPCTTSGIVDKFLVDHSNECGSDAPDLCSKKAAIMPRFLQSGWSSPSELLADNDGICEDEETEANETLTSSEQPEDNQAIEKSFPNMEIVETASHKPEQKNDGRPSNESQDLVFKNVNCFMDDFLFIKSASCKEDDPHFLDWTANELTSLLSSSKEYGFVECGKEMLLHSSDLDQHGAEDIKPHFAEGRQQGEEQFTPQILPESFHNDQVDDIHYENDGEISLRKVKNWMPHECKESAQQHGMRRRCLRFDASEAIRKRVGCSGSWNATDVVSIVRSPAGLTESQILNTSNVVSNKISSNNQVVNFSSNASYKLSKQPSKTPEDHMDEVERPARNSVGTPVTAATPSGIGLHLNRIGYDVADSCNLNRQLTAKDYLNVKGKNSLPETNLQISSFANPSKSSLQINLTEQHAMPFVNQRRPLEDVSNSVFNQMNSRQNKSEGTSLIKYKIPTRGLLGLRNAILTASRGTAVLTTVFDGYEPWAGEITTRDQGSLVAFEDGTTTSYALSSAQERGQMFVSPGVEVYKGKIVGIHQRPGDLSLNVCKKKAATNVRSNKEVSVILDTPLNYSLDDCIEYIQEDELVEVTPLNVRMCKNPKISKKMK